MKLSRQQELIVKTLRDRQWHCGSEWLGEMKDDRKRISELNDGYMREKGWVIIGERCGGKCGRRHSSGLFRRKAVPAQDTMLVVNADKLKWFDGLPNKRGDIITV